MNNPYQETLKARIAASLFESLLQICGGGLHLERIEDESCHLIDHDDSTWSAELKSVAKTTISFTNKQSTLLDGKPHDIEIRAALALFHRCAGRKRKRSNRTLHGVVSAVSDLGVKRSIESPLALAELLCFSLEESLRQESLIHDVRPNASGIICLVTPGRAKAMRDSGRLPCPKCVKWCKGEKGLWWHQQMEHGSEHSVAAAAAAIEQNVFAIVPYDPHRARFHPPTQLEIPVPKDECRDESDSNIFELVRKGNLDALKHLIEVWI